MARRDDVGIIEYIIFGVNGVRRDIYQHGRQTVRGLAGHLIRKPYLVLVEHKIGHIRGMVERAVGPFAGLTFSLRQTRPPQAEVLIVEKPPPNTQTAAKPIKMRNI